MKQIGHAWIGLMALARLRAKPSSKSYIGKNFESFYLGGGFDAYYKAQAAALADYFEGHKDAFVKGAWYPDNVISDNLTGGHTFKLDPAPPDAGQDNIVRFGQSPGHLSTKSLVKDPSRWKEKLVLKSGYNLPDRCEALSHSIRDMILIQRKEKKGSDILFSDDMITHYFLMLSHYVADAHVPPHCDARDFYTPSTIHPDMESYWDGEIKKHFSFDKARGAFDYDISGEPEVESAGKFEGSLPWKVIGLLSRRKWSPAGKEILGKGNKKPYDYIKAVCRDAYVLSTDFIASRDPAVFNRIRILDDGKYRARLEELSVHVLADAIDSVALLWLRAWDAYFKLEEQKKKKKAEIKKSEARARKK